MSRGSGSADADTRRPFLALQLELLQLQLQNNEQFQELMRILGETAGGEERQVPAARSRRRDHGAPATGGGTDGQEAGRAATVRRGATTFRPDSGRQGRAHAVREVDERAMRQLGEDLAAAEARAQKAEAKAATMEAELRQKRETVLELETENLNLRATLQGVRDVFTCSVPHGLCRNPVVASDGHSYDKKSIDAWLRRQRSSPMTRERLMPYLFPNRAVAAVLQQLTAAGFGPTDEEEADTPPASCIDDEEEMTFNLFDEPERPQIAAPARRREPPPSYFCSELPRNVVTVDPDDEVVDFNLFG